MVVEVFVEDAQIHASEDSGGLDDGRVGCEAAEIRGGNVYHAFVVVVVVFDLTRFCGRCLDVGVELALSFDSEPVVNALGRATGTVGAVM